MIGRGYRFIVLVCFTSSWSVVKLSSMEIKESAVKILPNLPVGFLGWSAGVYESAAPPESLSVGPAHPRPPGPFDAEPGAAAAPHSPSPPHPVNPADNKQKRKQGEVSMYFCVLSQKKP